MSRIDHNLTDVPDDTYTGRVWIKENEALIEKLEAAFKASPDKSTKDYSHQFYAIQVSKLNLLIDKSTSCELLEECVMYPIPLSEPWIAGVTNVRGDVIPVIDFDKGNTDNSNTKNLVNKKIIIINKGPDAFGLLLDELPKLIGFNFNEKLMDHSDISENIKEFVEYAYIKENITWVCIDFVSFINSIKN